MAMGGKKGSRFRVMDEEQRKRGKGSGKTKKQGKGTKRSVARAKGIKTPHVTFSRGPAFKESGSAEPDHCIFFFLRPVQAYFGPVWTGSGRFLTFLYLAHF